MIQNNYDKIVNTITEAVKTVAQETMFDLIASMIASEIRQNNKENVIFDTGISCDGSWQCRGYASNNGVVTVIYIDNGKILDVEPMKRKACNLKEQFGKHNPEAHADQRNTRKCTYKYQGSAGGIATVGAKRIFQRLIEKIRRPLPEACWYPSMKLKNDEKFRRSRPIN